MKDKALPILIFMVLKRSVEIKLRGIANRSYKRVYVDKTECILPTPDFYALKYACTTTVKEERDVVIVDLRRFFL